MTGKLTCCVITPVDNVSESHRRACQEAILAAKTLSMGPFDEVADRPMAGGAFQGPAPEADWMCYMDPMEPLAAEAFESLSPVVDHYDALWGGVAERTSDGGISVDEKGQYGCQAFVEFFHMALHWGLGRTHFVKSSALTAKPFGDGAAYADYLIALWHDHACLKSAQPISAGTDGKPGLTAVEKSRLVAYLSGSPQYMTFNHLGATIRLPYTGRNTTLERIQMRGVFFEQEELTFLKDRVPPGGTIVDVGANTGNHTIYFANFLNPAKVIPLEPNPDAIQVLRAAVAENGLSSVDFSKLGHAAGAKPGRAAQAAQRRTALGSVQFHDDADGAVETLPLDDLISETVDFLKIDVEGRELDVLLGANRILTRDRPLIFIEVTDGNIPDFLDLAARMDYAVERIFPDQGYANYFLAPVPSGKRHK